MYVALSAISDLAGNKGVGYFGVEMPRGWGHVVMESDVEYVTLDGGLEEVSRVADGGDGVDLGGYFSVWGKAVKVLVGFKLLVCIIVTLVLSLVVGIISTGEMVVE